MSWIDLCEPNNKEEKKYIKIKETRYNVKNKRIESKNIFYIDNIVCIVMKTDK